MDIPEFILLHGIKDEGELLLPVAIFNYASRSSTLNSTFVHVEGIVKYFEVKETPSEIMQMLQPGWTHG